MHDLWNQTEPGFRRNTLLGLMLHSHLPEILNNFIFGLVHCKWRPRAQCGVPTCRGNESSTCPPSLALHSTSPEFQWLPIAWEFNETQSQYKVNVLCLWLNRVLTARNYALCLNQSLLQTEIRQCHSKTHNRPTTIAQPLPLCSFPVLANNSGWKCGHRSERKMGWSTASSPSRLSLLIGEAEGRVLVGWAYKKKWKRTAELAWCPVPAVWWEWDTHVHRVQKNY